MKLLKVILAVVIWFIFWFGAQSLYLIPNLFSNINPTPNVFFVIYSLWIIFVSMVAVLIWKFTFKKFGFLKIKNKKWLLLYIIPVVLSVILIINGNNFGINRYLYTSAMFVTTFLGQDLLTFGFLQTYLEKITGAKTAAIITGLAFFAGHLVSSFSFGTLLMLVAAILFSFLRYRTKNIYLLNIIHISFSLLPIG